MVKDQHQIISTSTIHEDRRGDYIYYEQYILRDCSNKMLRR